MVLGGYTLTLLVLAYYFFFTHELRIFSYRSHLLSEDFMVRFSAFWFISFLLTIMVYLLNLSLNYLWLPRAEKTTALLAGKLILGLGLLGALVAILLFS